MSDRIGIHPRRHDAHPLAGWYSSGLDGVTTRLAGYGTVIQITAQMRVLVTIEPSDGRKGVDGLVRLCKEKLAEDPSSSSVFVFRSRSGTTMRNPVGYN